MGNAETIDNFTDGLDAPLVAVCKKLRAAIDKGLPQATSKLWHAIPVWFIGENAVVGYDIRKAGIALMFWNGQNFATPGLEASGSFHLGQALYTDPAQIDETLVARWLAEAGTKIWDLKGERAAFIAKRKAAAAKPKAKPKSKAKSKPKAKAASKKKTKKNPRSRSRRAPARKLRKK